MDPVVEFKEEDDKPMGGRRAKIEKEKKRKLKPGSFGQSSELCSSRHAILSELYVLLLDVSYTDESPHQTQNGQCRDTGAESDHAASHQEEGLSAPNPYPKKNSSTSPQWPGCGGNGSDRIWKDSSLCCSHAGKARHTPHAQRSLVSRMSCRAMTNCDLA